MKIYLHNSPVICNAASGETILIACAKSGIIFSAPCGGRHSCGKCRVRILKGRISGDTPDNDGFVYACTAVPVSDITIASIGSSEITDNEVTSPLLSAGNKNTAVHSASIAIDIGTTTVSAKLVNLENSEVLGTISELNDQRSFGADVMSRIGAARNGKTAELFNLINRQTERIINSFQKRWNIPKIDKLSVSGNTVMLHLFLNIDPSGMGEIPFTPVFLDEKELEGKALSLSADKVIIVPSIASFIGGDITSGLAVLDILDGNESSLFIDIGTNGEMALAHNGTIFCCSTAAGPAFEGAEISCGMGGVKGAISAVELSNNVPEITAIGNAPPAGICGSGLVDAIAVMLKQGIIDETGRMIGSQKDYKLAENVSITAGDIRQFQLAKSAILSGIKILCKNAGINLAEIKNVFVAGGFGFFINKYNAVYTGIFPGEFINSLTICGNLSLQGAIEILTTKNFMERCKKITCRCSIIDLAADPSFMDEFAENMLFNV